MFVRWKTYRVKRGNADRSYRVQIVECKRINGKPRQQIVAHLGGYRESDASRPLVRNLFWRRAEGCIKWLDAPEDVKQHIRDTIAARIAPLSPEEAEEEERRSRAWCEGFGRLLFGSRPMADVRVVDSTLANG